MFIYEFMSGIVDTVTGEGDEEFDPHKYRKIEKPTSYSDTMIHLLKGSIGAGILAMPEAARRMGIISTIVGVFFIGAFASYTIQLLILAQYELCKRMRKGYMSYPKSMQMAFKGGPCCLRWSSCAIPWFVDGVLLLWQLGICGVYVIFVAENIKQVFDYYGLVIPLRIHLCYLLPPLIILNMVKDLKLLTPLSSISNVITLLGLILVFYYLLEDDLDINDDKLHMKEVSDIPIFVGITLFALEAVGVVLALEYNMEHPKQFTGVCGLFNIGVCIIVMMYLIVGLFGYIKYGNDVEASLTLNLPENEKKAQGAKLIFALAIFLTFPLQNFVAYSVCWRKVKKRTTDSNRRCVDYTVRMIVIIIPWVAAVAMPRLGPFISLFGAFCLSLLALVFPAVMDMCVWYPNKYGFCHYKLFRDVFIIILGFMALFSGVYQSLHEILSKT